MLRFRREVFHYDDIQGDDHGAGAAPDSQFHAAPAAGQPAATDLFAGRRGHRGPVSGDRRPGGRRRQQFGDLPHPGILQRLLLRIRHSGGAALRRARLRRHAPLRGQRPAAGRRHLGDRGDRHQHLVRRHPACDAHPRQHLPRRLPLPAGHLHRHPLHLLLQPAVEHHPRIGRQPHALLVPALLDGAEHRARPLLHPHARLGRAGSGRGDSRFAGRFSRALLRLHAPPFRDSAQHARRTAVPLAARPHAAGDRTADGIAVLDHGHRQHHAPKRQQRPRLGLRGGLHGRRAHQDVRHLAFREPRHGDGHLHGPQLRRREARTHLAGHQGRRGADARLRTLRLRRADGRFRPAGAALHRSVAERDSRRHAAVPPRGELFPAGARPALHPALYNPGRRLHESGDAVGRLGDDRPHGGQPVGRTGPGLHRRLLRRR